MSESCGSPGVRCARGTMADALMLEQQRQQLEYPNRRFRNVEAGMDCGDLTPSEELELATLMQMKNGYDCYSPVYFVA